MKYLKKKDQNKRFTCKKTELINLSLKALFLYPDFSLDIKIKFLHFWLFKLKNKYFFTQIKNRCILTNRGASVYNQFGLSRLEFRRLSSFGKIVGVQKASW